MRLMVFSDAHGDINAIERVLEFNEDADLKVSLGDLECPENLLFKHDCVAITGNSMRDPGFVDHDLVEIEGLRLFMTHGHLFKVQRNLKRLLDHCKQNKCHVALFGHTHIAYHERIFGIDFFNPGSISRPRNTLPPTYLLITIEDGELSYEFRDAISNEIIEI